MLTKELMCVASGLTCEEEEDQDHNQSVAKVEDGAGRSNDLQLREEVMHSVDEEIDSGEAAGQEGTPPPVVILETYYHRHIKIQEWWPDSSALNSLITNFTYVGTIWS